VYKSKRDREAEKEKKADEISIEEIIEQQRAKLGATGGTPVTAESLAAYKKEKTERKKKEEEKKQKELLKKTGGKGISTYPVAWFIWISRRSERLMMYLCVQ
jgi:hypothetical protein